MRTLALVCVLVTVSSVAVARPKVAIAPFEHDADHKVGNAVAKAVSDDVEIVSPKATGRAMASLDLSGELDAKAVKKLRAKLDVDAVVQGTVEGKPPNKLELRVSRKGKKPVTFTIKFKNPKSTKFRDDVRAQLARRLGTVSSGEDEDEHEDEDQPRRVVERDPPRHERRAVDDDDGQVRKPKHRRRRDDDDGDPGAPAPRHPVTQVAVRVNAGASVARRTLTYSGAGTTQPPPVGTVGAAGTFAAEVYPGATSTLNGLAASLGVYAELDKTLGVKIRVPGTQVDAGIDQAHYAIGVRYRFSFGTSTLAVGAAYARWHYVADRSGLMTPTALDMPDVDYAAIAPGAIARFAAGDQLGVFVGADAMLLLGAGPIVDTTNYGFADIIAFELQAGVDVALASNYALRFGADVTQFGLSFTGKGMSGTRGISSATDRMIGLAASFAITY